MTRRFVTGATIGAVAAVTAIAAPAFGSGSAGSQTQAQSAGGPSPAQIQRQIRKAKSSPGLWATVNRCNHPRLGVVGVRGQMPALSFTSHLLMDIRVQYKTPHGYIDVPNAEFIRDLGRDSNALDQGGFDFPFKHAGRIRGVISFIWKLHGHVIGSTTRITTAGHTGVDFGLPAGTSRATCRVR